MNQTLEELLHLWHQGEISEEQLRRLTQLLETWQGRETLRRDWYFEAGIAESLRTPPPLELLEDARWEAGLVSRRRNAWFQWRPLTAAAAGLVAGLFCASVVFGYVIPLESRGVSLLHESFESGPPLESAGPKLALDHWSGDYSEVVGAQEGVKPIEGAKMCRILRADHEGKVERGGYMGDLFHLVDVRPYRKEFEDGNVFVQFSAAFNATSFSPKEKYRCAVSIQALDAEAVAHIQKTGRTVSVGDQLAAAHTARKFMDRNPATWQRMSSELRVPEGTDYLLVHVFVIGSHLAQETVTFKGHYVDDVELSLVHRLPGATVPPRSGDRP